MKEVETLVYSRLTGDNEATIGILALLGSSTHIMHAFEDIVPVLPYLTFQIFSIGQGILGGNFGRSLSVMVQFNAFGTNYADVLARVRKLFDGYRFDVPSQYTDVGQLRSVFDFEGPDGWDAGLEVPSKQVRYQFFVTPKAWNPITA